MKRGVLLLFAAAYLGCAGGGDEVITTANDFGSNTIGDDIGVTTDQDDVGNSESGSNSADSSSDQGDVGMDGGGTGQPGDPCTEDADCEDYCNIPDGHMNK